MASANLEKMFLAGIAFALLSNQAACAPLPLPLRGQECGNSIEITETNFVVNTLNDVMTRNHAVSDAIGLYILSKHVQIQDVTILQGACASRFQGIVGETYLFEGHRGLQIDQGKYINTSSSAIEAFKPQFHEETGSEVNGALLSSKNVSPNAYVGLFRKGAEWSIVSYKTNGAGAIIKSETLAKTKREILSFDYLPAPDTSSGLITVSGKTNNPHESAIIRIVYSS